MKPFHGHFPIMCIGLDNKIFQRTIVNIFLPINFNICFGCSEEPSQSDYSFEPSQPDSSFEYPHHMFWLRNKKNNFLIRILN